VISVKFAWVALAFGNSFLGINMRYFVIYACISPITLDFGLFGFSLSLISQVLGEKHQVEAKSSQGS